MKKHSIEQARRKYNKWAATESIEDYALRYSPSSYRQWSPFLIANTALGSISFLALEAIGASLLLDYGFTNAFWAITAASIIIFLCSTPITYYCARYNIDIDLLTRSAGFGYVGSTVTSLIYASFSFIFFALEAAIMAQALLLYFQLPLYLGYIFCSLIIIPLVFYGISLINKLHLWTQPIWLVLMLTPFYFVLTHEPKALESMIQFAGHTSNTNQFDVYYFGLAMGISLALIAQIGEQVDYLRFMPEKTSKNQVTWWFTVLMAGPGWIILGFLKQIGGILLAALVIMAGLSFEDAKQPIQMYSLAYTYVFDNQETALFIAMVFVIISQVKINVTNAYAGSLAWSNFFSRITHSHPGRVIWLVFNILIALILMEMGVFHGLEKILGLYSNVAIAWIGAMVADLVVNKPLKLSPPVVEFKRAHLYDFNPVGFGSMVIASIISIIAFTGVLGLYAQAYSSLIALSTSFILSPLIAKLTQGKYYIARNNLHYSHSNQLETCGICEQQYAHADFAYCDFHQTPICSLCCTLDSNCHDSCKPPSQEFSQIIISHILNFLFQNKLSKKTLYRISQFSLFFGSLLLLMSFIFWLTFSIQTEQSNPELTFLLYSSYQQIYIIFAILLSIAAWGIVLIHESRTLAEAELNQHNEILAKEIIQKESAEKTARELTQSLQNNLNELTITHAKLSESEELFRDLIHSQSAIFWRVDAKTFQYTFISDQVESLLGYPIKAWLAENFWVQHIHPDDKKWVVNYCSTETQAHRAHEFEYRMLTANGHTIWIKDVVNLIIINNEVTELTGFMIDITQSKQDQVRIQYLSDLYATLSKINHAIVHTNNESELFRKLCDVTVQFRSLSMAWVGIKHPTSTQIIPISRSGEHLDYLDNIYISTDPSLPEGNGPTGIAYREQKIMTANHFLLEEKMSTWKEKAQNAHWASSCAIPIPRGGKAYAVLNVYSKILDYFSKDIIQLLSELGNDLTFALDSIDREIARKKAEKALELSAKVFAQSQEGIIITDNNNLIISTNTAFTRITGYSAKEAQGTSPTMLSSTQQTQDFYDRMWQAIQEQGYWQGELFNRKKNGDIFPQWMTISKVMDHNQHVINYITSFSDISEHKKTEAQIEYMAHYDPLTDLANRVLFKERINHQLAMAHRKQSRFALLFLDLDHFKNINDSLGHSIGDKLLIEVANRLKSVAREEDTVSRWGGDEFNILLTDTYIKGAVRVAKEIINVMSPSMLIENNKLHISFSIGISLYPDNGQDYETLYKTADIALYHAKDSGRNQYQFFTPEMQKQTMRRMEIEIHLRHAIENNEFVLFYQPQVDTKTKGIIGAEALIRWMHPEWGIVSPAEFIPIAEDTGLIIPIGDWVLKEALSQVKSWHQSGYSKISIAVNLSLAQFNDQLLFNKVQQALQSNNIEAHYLELELTESIAMKNAEAAISITRQLTDLGIQLSIDDFGTGYSSLSYLQQFSLHKLKIDQSFSFNMVDNKETENIVNAIISMANSLHLKTIAEGVETVEQLNLLEQKQCDEIQGYYFSRPVPAAEFTQLLKNQPFQAAALSKKSTT